MPFDNDGNVVKEKKVVIVYADTVGPYKLYRRPVTRRGLLGLLRVTTWAGRSASCS